MGKNKFKNLRMQSKQQSGEADANVKASYFANKFDIFHIDKFYEYFTEQFLTKNENVLHVPNKNEYYVRLTDETNMYFRAVLKALDGFDDECEIEEIKFYKAGVFVKGSGVVELPKVRNNGYRAIMNFRQKESSIGSYVETSPTNLNVKIQSYKSYGTILVPSMTEMKLYTSVHVPNTNTDIAASLYLIIDFVATTKFAETVAVKIHEAQMEHLKNGGFGSMLTNLGTKLNGLSNKFSDLSKIPGIQSLLQGHSQTTVQTAIDALKNGESLEGLQTKLQTMMEEKTAE